MKTQTNYFLLLSLPGMNPLVLYLCHDIFYRFFPVNFRVANVHWALLLKAVWDVIIWLVLGFYLYCKKIFIALQTRNYFIIWLYSGFYLYYKKILITPQRHKCFIIQFFFEHLFMMITLGFDFLCMRILLKQKTRYLCDLSKPVRYIGSQ